MSTSRERRENRDLEDEKNIIDLQIKRYERLFREIYERKDIIYEDKMLILQHLANARLSLRKNKIKESLEFVLHAHDIYFEYIFNMKSKPWDDKFSAFLVKYNLNRD